MSETSRYGIQYDVMLNGEDAYTHTKSNRQAYGYILEWKFASGTELKADQEVPNPEDPPKTMKVVAVMDLRQRWVGGRSDPILMTGRVSSANKAALNTCLNAEEGGADCDITFHYIDYDPTGKAFFPSFHTKKSMRKFTITPGTLVEVASKPCDKPADPQTYIFSGSFTAKGDAGPQELFCAENIGLKTTKPFGGIGAGG